MPPICPALTSNFEPLNVLRFLSSNTRKQTVSLGSKNGCKNSSGEIFNGVIIASIVFFCYNYQTYGLTFINASQASKG